MKKQKDTCGVNNYMIPYNKPFISPKEINYITESINSRLTAGDGPFTKAVSAHLCSKFNFSKVLLTTSCTDAIEMAATLLGLKPDDEIIVPSYTFVSTVLPFINKAKIVFCDSKSDSPHLDINHVGELLTNKTKAIVPVHYAGIGCDIVALTKLIEGKNITIIEDAAQCINSYYHNQALGSFGSMGCMSFHESKNLSNGEGGALIINDTQLSDRAEIIREKGTDRSKFFRGEIDKYGWVDIGSSHLMSDILAAKLRGQLESLYFLQETRNNIFDFYMNSLDFLREQGIKLPVVTDYNKGNAHIFYLVMKTLQQRNDFIEFMKLNNIHCVFHYQSLHKSTFYKPFYKGRELTNSDHYADCLVRLPIYPDLKYEEMFYIVNKVKEYFNGKV